MNLLPLILYLIAPGQVIAGGSDFTIAKRILFLSMRTGKKRGVESMNLLPKEELKLLMGKENGLCMSLFMPVYRGEEAQQNQIRFKNLLKEAEGRLISSGLSIPEVKGLLDPAYNLIRDELLWCQDDGLAVFVSGKLFSYYLLPLEFEELLVVTDRFHIKPLMSLIINDGLYYILAVSKNEVKFYQGTRSDIREVVMEGIPNNIYEVLKYDDPEKQLQVHSGNHSGGPIFHGHGFDSTKDNLLRYFRKIDKGVQEMLHSKRAPLILAGVEYFLPIYKKANKYPYLLDEVIKGNPEVMSARELHEKAWAIVQPFFKKKQKEAAEKYMEFLGTGLTSKDIKENVLAAYYGKVDTLFVAVGVQKWGAFNPETNEVNIHSKAEPGDEDLLNLAAVHTFLNGGTVFAVEPKDVPDNAFLAAVFRY